MIDFLNSCAQWENTLKGCTNMKIDAINYQIPVGARHIDLVDPSSPTKSSPNVSGHLLYGCQFM